MENTYTTAPGGDSGDFAKKTAHWQQNRYADYGAIALKKSAAAGDPYACLLMAERYDTANASSTELQDAGRYYEAAIAGLEQHCTEAGGTELLAKVLLQAADFCDRTDNPRQRFTYLTNAYELTHAGAMELAGCYLQGDGCDKDVQKAITLYEIAAAEQKSCEAYLTMAMLCHTRERETDAQDYCEAALTAEDAETQPVLRDAARFLQADIRQEGGPVGAAAAQAYRQLMHYDARPALVEDILRGSTYLEVTTAQAQEEADQAQEAAAKVKRAADLAQRAVVAKKENRGYIAQQIVLAVVLVASILFVIFAR